MEDMRKAVRIPAAAILSVLCSCEEQRGEEVSLNDRDNPAASSADPAERKAGQASAPKRDPELDLALQQARTGDAKAQYELATLYAKRVAEGRASMDQVVEWAQKAAAQNHVEAMMTLAGMYYTGTEIPRDPAGAVQWFEKAAALGSHEADLFLGRIYLSGDGVDADLAKGRDHMRRAADAGLPAAMGFLGRAEREGAFGFDKDEGKGLELMKQAALKGDRQSAVQVGKIIYQGQGVEANPAEAFTWYKKAAEQGDPEAQYIVALMYYTGEGVEKNFEQAVPWLKLAAGQNHISAMGLLSFCYSTGTGIKADENIARVWRERMEKLQTERDSAKK